MKNYVIVSQQVHRALASGRLVDPAARKRALMLANRRDANPGNVIYTTACRPGDDKLIEIFETSSRMESTYDHIARLRDECLRLRAERDVLLSAYYMVSSGEDKK